MALSKHHGIISGLILGIVIAALFAVAMRFVPADWLLNPMKRALLYGAQIPAALLFIPISKALSRLLSESPQRILLLACVGALAFDGLMLGFWPQLYGHEQQATSHIAALLLWAFAWILAAAIWFAPDGKTRAHGL